MRGDQRGHSARSDGVSDWKLWIPARREDGRIAIERRDRPLNSGLPGERRREVFGVEWYEVKPQESKEWWQSLH